MARADDVTFGRTYKSTASDVSKLIRRVKGNLDNWHKRDDITCIYIGKTSYYSDYINDEKASEAMSTRIDKRKREMKTEEMVLLYNTSSESNVETAEDEIIQYNITKGETTGKVGNTRAGGGGRDGGGRGGGGRGGGGRGGGGRGGGGRGGGDRGTGKKYHVLYAALSYRQ